MTIVLARLVETHVDRELHFQKLSMSRLPNLQKLCGSNVPCIETWTGPGYPYIPINCKPGLKPFWENKTQWKMKPGGPWSHQSLRNRGKPGKLGNPSNTGHSSYLGNLGNLHCVDTFDPKVWQPCSAHIPIVTLFSCFTSKPEMRTIIDLNHPPKNEKTKESKNLRNLSEARRSRLWSSQSWALQIIIIIITAEKTK